MPSGGALRYGSCVLSIMEVNCSLTVFAFFLCKNSHKQSFLQKLGQVKAVMEIVSKGIDVFVIYAFIKNKLPLLRAAWLDMTF